MRKLIYAINISLDGRYDHTKFYAHEETTDYFTDLIRESDTLVYGRKTYELMVPYWPDVAKNPDGDREVDMEFARAFDAIKNMVVFSRSLTKADEKTTIVNTDLRAEILKLKQQPGKNIMTGGVNLPAQLIELDLIDEYHFVVHPIIVGEGEVLFEGVHLQEKLQLKLAGSKVLAAGCIALMYQK